MSLCISVGLSPGFLAGSLSKSCSNLAKELRDGFFGSADGKLVCQIMCGMGIGIKK